MLLASGVLFFVFAFTFNEAFADTDRGVNADSSSSSAEDGLADLVSVCNDSRAGNLDHWQSLIKRSHGIPEIWLSTPDAAMTDTYGPNVNVIETNCRTV